MNKSIGPNLKYIKQIEEQKHLINFLQQKYKEQTGYDAQIPQTYSSQIQNESKTHQDFTRSILVPQSKSLTMGARSSVHFQDEEEEKISPPKALNSTFQDALQLLQLPQRKSGTRSTKVLTTFDLKNKYHMVECLDLSKFKGKVEGLTKQLFNEFVQSIQEMQALQSVTLTHNAMDDSYGEALGILMTHPKITRLDVSHNEIGPKGIKPLIASIKQHKQMKSINLTRNCFSHDLAVITSLSQALLSCPNLIHCTLDAHRPPQVHDKQQIIYKGGDVICKMALQHKSLSSLYLIDSHITDDGIELLQQTLISPKNHLTELSLKYCFLHLDQVRVLTTALHNNHSLVHLDLQHNNLDNAAGVYLCEMLKVNHHLHCINLQHNSLSCDFLSDLSAVLIKNHVLAIVKLGFNNFEAKGVKQLLSVPHVQDFGDIDRNPIGVGLVSQISQKLSNTDEISDYSITKPINFAASLQRSQANFKLWNI